MSEENSIYHILGNKLAAKKKEFERMMYKIDIYDWPDYNEKLITWINESGRVRTQEDKSNLIRHVHIIIDIKKEIFDTLNRATS